MSQPHEKWMPPRGVVVPVVTPSTPDSRLDADGAHRVLQHVVEAGAHPFVLGTTGEGCSVPLADRHELVRLALEVAGGRVPVYASISDNCLSTSLELADRFFEWGVAAVVAHVPHYYPLDEVAIHRYFETLAEKLPGPLVLYNIPATTHHWIPLDVAEALSHHPRVVGLKDSGRDLERLREASQRWKNRGDFSLLIGWAAKSVDGLRWGAQGLVPSTGNVVPGMFQELYEAAVAGDWEAAERWQKRTDAIASIYQEGRTLSQSLAGLKGMLHLMGLCGPHVFPPLQPVGQEELEQLRSKMASLDLPLANSSG